MDDLIAFLRARLDEDEAAAKAWLLFGNPDATAREHIARQDPGRVLREVEVMRAIIKLREIASVPDFDDDQWNGGYDCAMRDVLSQIAAVWSDHPDYRQEWAVAG